MASRLVAVFVALYAGSGSLGAGANQGTKPARIVLEGESACVEIDPQSGVITSLRDPASSLRLEAPPGMAENFRLTLLKPDKTPITILGRNQKLSNSHQDSRKVSLHWEGPLHDTAGSNHDVSVRMDVVAAGGSLEFTLHLENRTTCKVQEAWYPLVGGLTRFCPSGQLSDATLWLPTSTPTEKPLKLPFRAAALGYPGQLCMSFCSIQSKAAGRCLYFSSQDGIARYKTYRFMEFAGPAGTKDIFACIQHSPFTPAGGTFDGSPVACRFLAGDWRAGGGVYREWFQHAFGIAQPSQCWIRGESFFLMSMFMLPEGTINFTFRDMPHWAKAAKDHGLHAVQISGWQVGGHDNGYPDYSIDPRLGTWKELEDGIRQCHKMGVRVYFFVNYQPIMLDSDWYKTELHHYREMAANGGLTWNAGWGMGTLWARMDHPKLMTWADPAFPQFRKIIVDQFARLARIGADGVHVDKMFPTAIDYNADVPMSPDTATWEGAILLTKEVFAACRKDNPDWAMSFECNWDRLLEFTGSTWWVGNQTITRQVFPEHVETLGLYEAYDYLGVNNAVRNGHQVMVAPLRFCRSVDWAPFRDLADYLKEVKRIRDRLQETVFYGEVLGRSGIRLKDAFPGGLEYSVFRHRKTGRRVCVITDSRLESGRVTILEFEGKPNGRARLHAPFERLRQVRLPATIEVPGEHIVFLEELDAPAPDSRSQGVASLSPQRSEGRGQSGGRVKNVRAGTSPINGGFESGNFTGWMADSNWVVVDNSCGYYRGWQGKYWAWSGGKGEPATGVLKSKPFVLDNDAVRLLISGWNSTSGTGKPRKWNYVTLNLEDGPEIDRVYAPNTTSFVPAILDGSSHKGQKVYVQAVDDADQPTYSMLCLDEVRTASLPKDLKRPVPVLRPFSAKKSFKLENASCLVEVSRANGSLTRIRDKAGELELILEPRLAGSYQFALPIPGKEPWQTIEANWIFGREQRLTACREEGQRLVLRWEGPLKNYLGEKFTVSVTETIELARNGILFNLSIENSSAYPIGEVYFPLIGGVQGLGRTRGQLKATEMVRPAPGGSCAMADIFRVFASFSWLGDHGPEQYYAFPKDQPEPWVGFGCAKIGRSVCLGALEPSDRNLVIRLELLPAGSGTTRDDGNWPRVEELKGLPAGVELSFVDIAHCPAPRTYQATPVFLEFLSGGGQEMRKSYARWRVRN